MVFISLPVIALKVGYMSFDFFLGWNRDVLIPDKTE